jgi:phosphoribosylamine--glycine ligase
MARILMCSYSGYGAWFMARLIEEGHSVDYFLDAPLEFRKKPNPIHNIGRGIIPPPLAIGKDEPEFSKYDLVLFDLTGREGRAERSLEQTPTMGDGQVHKTLEENRNLALEIMKSSDIAVPEWEVFDDVNEAKKFIKKTKKRYVFKPNGGQEQDTATTYVSKDYKDLLTFLDELSKESKGAEFILQEFVTGTEVSCEAWFNGSDFTLINNTLEEKKLMNDGLGPATGCAGNIVWVTEHPRGNKLFREGVEKLKSFFTYGSYKGMIDLNCIVTDEKLYGIEFTPRFGYDATSTLFALINSNLGDFLSSIAAGERASYTLSGAFAASIRLSIPPYPTEVPGKHPQGIEIKGFPKDIETLSRFYYTYDVMLDESSRKKSEPRFTTAGASGFITSPIALGDSVIGTLESAKQLAEKFHIPNLQYRTDLAGRLDKRYRELGGMGWLR